MAKHTKRPGVLLSRFVESILWFVDQPVSLRCPSLPRVTDTERHKITKVSIDRRAANARLNADHGKRELGGRRSFQQLSNVGSVAANKVGG